MPHPNPGTEPRERILGSLLTVGRHDRSVRIAEMAIGVFAVVALMALGPGWVPGAAGGGGTSVPLPTAAHTRVASAVWTANARAASNLPATGPLTSEVGSQLSTYALLAPRVQDPGLAGLGSTWNGIHLFSVFGGSNGPAPAASWSGWDWGGSCPDPNPSVPSFQYIPWEYYEWMPPYTNQTWIWTHHPEWIEYSWAQYQNYTGSGWTTSAPLRAPVVPDGVHPIVDMTNPAVQNFIIQTYVEGGSIGPNACDGVSIDMYHSSNTDGFNLCESSVGGNCVSYLNSTTNLVGHYNYSSGSPVWVSQFAGDGTQDAAYENAVAIGAMHYFALRWKMEAANLSMPAFPIVVNDDGWEGDLYGGGTGVHEGWYYGSGPYYCGGWDDPMGSADILASENGFDGINDGNSLCMNNTWLTMAQSFILEGQHYGGGIALIGSPVFTGAYLHEWWSNITVGTNTTAQDARAYLNWTVGNYLLVKGNYTWFYIADGPQGYTGLDYWEPEYASPIGHPTGPMFDLLEPTGSGGQLTRVYMRNYTGGIAVVNPSRTNWTNVTFPAGEYVDMQGDPVTTWTAGPVGPWTEGGYGTATVLLFRHLTISASANPSSGSAPLTVSFTGTAAGGSPPFTTWAWRFGDGGTSALQNPTHTYTLPGTYDVTLNVTDSARTTATGSVTVTVLAAAVPISISAFTAAPPAVSVGGRSYLNVSASGGTGSLAYAYTGLPSGCLTVDSPSLRCDPSTAGSYTVRAFVNGTVGESANATTSLTVNPTLSSLSVSPSTKTLSPGSAATFSTTATCLGGPCPATGVTYAWSLTNALGSLSSTTSSWTTFTAGSAAGTASLFVNGTLNGVSQEATATVTISAPPIVPTLASVSVNPTSAALATGGSQTFTASATCSGGSCPSGLTYTWALSSPLGSVSPSFGGSTTFTAASAAGSTTLSVQASLNGRSAWANATITISVPAPQKSNGFLGLNGEMDLLLGLVLGLLVAVPVAIWAARRRGGGGDRQGSFEEGSDGAPPPPSGEPEAAAAPLDVSWSPQSFPPPGDPPPYSSASAGDAPTGWPGASWSIPSSSAIPIDPPAPSDGAIAQADHIRAGPGHGGLDSRTPAPGEPEAAPSSSPAHPVQGGVRRDVPPTSRSPTTSWIPEPAGTDATGPVPDLLSSPSSGGAMHQGPDRYLEPDGPSRFPSESEPACLKCGAPLLLEGHPCIACMATA